MAAIIMGNNGSSGAAYADGGMIALRETSRYDTDPRIARPFDTWATQDRPSTAYYNGRVYGVGGFTENWMLDEFHRCVRQGMRPPSSPPTVGVGGGATNYLCYLRFYDELTGERSPFSDVTSVTGAVPRAWTVLPTEEPGYTIKIGGTTTVNASTTVVGSYTTFLRIRVGDRIAVSSAPTVFVTVTAVTDNTTLTVDTAIGDGTSQTITVKAEQRASHIELWVGEAGLLPRLRARRQLGVTAVTESVTLLNAGESSEDAYEAMPRGTINAIYHGRQLVAGVAGQEDTLFISDMFYPERWSGLTEITQHGDAITGIASERDYALITTPTSSYTLQGYTEDDFRFDLSDPGLGCANHFGMVNIHGFIWVPNEQGVYLFNGSWHHVMKDRAAEWRAEYAKYRRDIEKGYGVHDEENHCYKLVWRVPEDDPMYGPSEAASTQPDPFTWIWMISHRQVIEGFATQPGTYEWVAEYSECLPQAGGSWSQPNWTNFYRRENLVSQASIKVPRSRAASLLIGRQDSMVTKQSREVVVAGSNEWEFDEWLGRAMLLTPHYTMGVPGGFGEEGKILLRAWSYVICEVGDGQESWYWTFTPVAGDDACGWIGAGMSLVAKPDEVAATALTVLDDDLNYYSVFTPVTVHPHAIPNGVSGRGFSFLYEVWSCPDWEFSGVGGYWDTGRALRPPQFRYPEGS